MTNLGQQGGVSEKTNPGFAGPDAHITPAVNVGNLAGVLDPNPVREPPGIAGALDRLHAEQAIRQVWENEGGPRSSVGVPAGGDLVVVQNGADWEAHFRSGTITINAGENMCQVDTKHLLHVDFVGLECVSRQEKSDEIYGVIGVIGPSNHQFPMVRIPGGSGTVSMGRQGQRLWTNQLSLYQDAREDVVLVAALVEHDDFTDVEQTSKDIADKIVKAAGDVVSALSGIPAEAATQDTWFRDGIAKPIGWILGDMFGMGDDPYDGQMLRVALEDLGDAGPAPQPPRTRPDDPKSIPHWTHRITLTGYDDGGDYGQYEAYFNVWVEDIDTVRRCPIPGQ